MYSFRTNQGIFPFVFEGLRLFFELFCSKDPMPFGARGHAGA